MKKRMCGVSLSAVLLMAVAGQTVADEMLVIPDIAAAYLYDQAGSSRNVGNQVSLALIKEGSFKEYLIESNPPGFICDERCVETAQNLPEGKVTLRIVGKKPVSFMNIPLVGKWSGECDPAEGESADETARCVVQLSDMTEPIRVEVSPDINVGTPMPLPGGGQGLIVKVDTREGYVMVAGHQLLGSGKTLLNFNQANPLQHANLNISSPLDGRTNMPKLLAQNSEAAQYCAGLDGGDWYLPASGELKLMTREAMNKVSGLDMADNGDTSYLWTSTQNGKGLTSADPKKEIVFQAHAWRNNTASMQSNRDAYRFDPRKAPDKQLDHIRRYQVLCFRRLSI